MTEISAIVLASTSPYRAALLARLGVRFETLAPDYEESNAPGVDPGALVRAQARGKSESLRAVRPRAIIIGSDQVADLEGEILTKPGTAEAARAQLRRLSGREHRLLTAVCISAGGDQPILEALEVTRLGVRDLTEGEIERYVALDDPLDCAGSYKIETLGISLFDYQRGDDPTAVIGLPLMATSRLLRELGVPIP